MRYRMMTDKPLEKFVDGMSVDIKYWNDGIDELTKVFKTKNFFIIF